METLSFSPTATKKVAELLAKELLKHKIKSDNAFIVGLIGNLGSGKTTFIKGFVRGLRLKQRVVSPTFLIVRNYKIPIYKSKTGNYVKFYHIDAYRLKKSSELLAIDFKKIITNPDNIIFVEWADKIKQSLPKKMLWIKFKYGKKENERIINIDPRNK